MRIDEIAESIRSTPRRSGLATRVIAIDGCAGAGKSTLAERVGQILSAPVVRIDDFASWEEPFGWAPRFLSEVLEPVARGEALHFQAYDWMPPEPREWIEIPPSPILIIEGVGSSRLDFLPYIDFSVWVETERSVRLQRGAERDGIEMTDHWLDWITAEDEYIRREQPDKRADLVVYGQ